jgi:hypothetical protein
VFPVVIVSIACASLGYHFMLALSALVAPLAENPACYQNPFHRFLATGNFLSFFNLESTVTIGAAASINAASPWF